MRPDGRRPDQIRAPEITPGFIRLTRQGRALADTIAAELLP